MMIAHGITRQLTDRLEVDAELRGGLPKHDDNTVYKDNKEAGREKFEKTEQKGAIKDGNYETIN